MGSDLDCKAEVPGRVEEVMVGDIPGEEEDDDDAAFAARGNEGGSMASLEVTADDELTSDVFGSGIVCD